MKKTLGILSVLVVVCLLAWIGNPDFLSAYNIQIILKRAALYGILGIGAALVIMAGGIDLSTGSMVALVGCVLLLLIARFQFSLPVACLMVAILAGLLGLIHGLLITKLRLPAFIVTLCGL